MKSMVVVDPNQTGNPLQKRKMDAEGHRNRIQLLGKEFAL
jgi:hypothetical protein